MLTDEQIAQALAHVDKRYQKVCRMYLEKVGATVRELGHLNRSRINLLVQLQKMGVSERQIIRELQKATDLTKQDIRRLYHKAAEESMQDARYLYLSRGKPPDWKPLEFLVQAMWEQTAGKLDNLSGTTAVGKAYRQIVDEAVTAVTMGVEDYNSAIRNSLRLLGRAGLQVEYESGQHRRLESAIRQNILDGVRQVQQEARKIIGEQIGADGVEISAHPNSAPDHEPVQGRQFPLEEFQKMQAGADFRDADGKTYAGFSRPITQWRCRHLVSYIILGVSKRLYSDEQLKKWSEDNHKGCEIDGRHYTTYEATQLMRRLETEIRREKDTVLLAQASGDDILRRSSQVRVTQLTAKYEQVAKAADLRTRFEKTRVAGYSPKHAKEAARASAQIDPETERFIQLDKTRQARLRADPTLALPNAENVNISQDKFVKYLFNQDNPRGYAKGVAFSERLGYDIGNWEELSGEIKARAKLYPANPKGDAGHGMKYEQLMVLYGKKNKPANVVVSWIVENGIPRMTSSYIKEVKKNEN